MVKYILRRLLQAIPTLLGISVLSYLLMSLAPGGPVEALTFGPRTKPQDKIRLAAQLGLNDPVPIQYLRWLLGDDWMRWDSDGDGVSDGSFIIPLDADGDGVPERPGERQGFLRGDWGRSYFEKRSVSQLIGDRVIATLELGIASLSIGIVVGLPIGIYAAVRRGGVFDNLTRIFAVAFSAIPTFWLGLLLILFFAVFLKQANGDPFLPLGGRAPASLSKEYPPIWERLQYLILPTFVLAAGGIAGFSRFMRASMLDVINQDYMRTARSKGLNNRAIWFKHGARNALIPIATFLGPAFAGILGGAPLTETVFSWPGLGQKGVAAVLQQDYPVVMAVVMIGATSTVIGFILSDIMYALIDPRIRFS
jgi:peptide/nickel transport system permease protein